MSDIAIRVDKLAKRYRIGKLQKYKALRDVLTNLIFSPFHAAKGILHKMQPIENEAPENIFWALKDVSFEVKQGEVMGIIGRNGAGKSTLLKILSRITEPTDGYAEIHGRLGSLLEVGTGFHPELTGRENIYLNGAILGMHRAEITRKFDEIVAFSEIEKFLDTPVKHYSSGMYMRLAFAVAAHIETEILLVDEVLAVGDAQFQKKCLGKMKDVSKNEGRTVLFVSHNMAAISSLCKSSLFLAKGFASFYDRTSEAILEYYNSTGENVLSNRTVGDENVILLRSAVENEAGQSRIEVSIHDTLYIKMAYQILKKNNVKMVPNFHFYISDGNCAFVSSTPNIEPLPLGIYEAICEIPANFLNEGTYFVGLAITSYSESSLHVNFYDHNALTFNVRDPMDEKSNRYGYVGAIPGAVRPMLKWQIKGIDL